MSKVYVDNAQNRKLGRVGMTYEEYAAKLAAEQNQEQQEENNVQQAEQEDISDVQQVEQEEIQEIQESEKTPEELEKEELLEYRFINGVRLGDTVFKDASLLHIKKEISYDVTLRKMYFGPIKGKFDGAYTENKIVFRPLNKKYLISPDYNIGTFLVFEKIGEDEYKSIELFPNPHKLKKGQNVGMAFLESNFQQIKEKYSQEVIPIDIPEN